MSYTSEHTGAEIDEAIGNVADKADKTNVLEKDNTTEFTPTGDYNPATKKYVDDNASGDLSESVIVNVSTEDSASVDGQIITLTDLSVSGDSDTYTLGTGETSHTFQVVVGHTYKVSVNDKTGYGTPSETSEFEAVAGYIRNISLQYIQIIRYGFKRDKNNSDPDTRIEYLYDAVGMTPAYMDFGVEFNEGDWGTFIDEVQRQVMLKYDGTVDYELDPTDDTKKLSDGTTSDVSNTAYQGNAMVAFRKFKWVYRYEDTSYEYVIFSNTQYDANYKALAHTNENGDIQDEFYWGKYMGSYSDSKLRSLADESVMVSQTANTEVSRAQNNGSGHYIIYNSAWNYICDLLTLVSKSDDSQSKFGSGRSKTTNSSGINTGSLKTSGLFYGYTDETSDVKIFGIECFWGNYWQRMAGLILAEDGKFKVQNTPPYNFDGSGYEDSGISPSGSSGSYVDTASVTELGYLPKTLGGSSSTYYCDGMWYDFDDPNYARVGGGWDHGLLVGSRSLTVGGPASHTNANIGSRLSYITPA